MAQKKEVKLENIAKELGISIVSVSNALKGKKGVSEQLRLKVMEKAEQLGYQVKLAEHVEEKKSYRIGVIVAERYIKEFPSFYMDIYKRIAQEATKRGSFTILEIINEEKERMEQEVSVFSDIEIQGMIIIGELNPAYIKEAIAFCQVPVVCVDYYGTEKEVDYIVSDSYGGMQAVTQYLIDHGHKEIVFLGTIEATNSIMDRYQGYCKGMTKNRFPERKDWVISDRSKDGYGYQIDFELPKELPTAFVCNCDRTAYLLIEKLEQRGYRVPEDISVVGFDHYGYQSQEKIKLVTYENDEKAIAQISVNTLMKKMVGKRKCGEIRIVEGKLIEGNTVGNPSFNHETEKKLGKGIE